jgi:multicomponent Na+:H+ antiporter subunit E
MARCAVRTVRASAFVGGLVKLPLILGLVLFGVWLLWSGHDEPLLVSLGAVSVLAVVAIAVRMRIVDDEGVPTGLPWRAPIYLPWLFWEILKANVHVAGRILNPRLPIHPTVIRVSPGQKSDLGRVIYANSITLTPGTVALYVDDDEIVVHALTREAAEGLRSGEMNRRATAYEGKR